MTKSFFLCWETILKCIFCFAKVTRASKGRLRTFVESKSQWLLAKRFRRSHDLSLGHKRYAQRESCDRREDYFHWPHRSRRGRSLAPFARIFVRLCRRRSETDDLGHQVKFFRLLPIVSFPKKIFGKIPTFPGPKVFVKFCWKSKFNIFRIPKNFGNFVPGLIDPVYPLNRQNQILQRKIEKIKI